MLMKFVAGIGQNDHVGNARIESQVLGIDSGDVPL